MAIIVAAVLGGRPDRGLTQPPPPATRSLAQVWRVDHPGTMLCVAVGDLDGDGRGEVVAGSDDEWAYVVEASGETKWKLPGTGAVRQVAVADLFGDGSGEILFASDHLSVWSGDGKGLWSGTTHCRAFAVGDLDDEPQLEVVTSGSAGVQAFDAEGTLLWTGRKGNDDRSVCPGGGAVGIGDLDGDGRNEVVCARSEAIQAFTGEGQALWQAPPAGERGHRWCSGTMAVDDLDGDGKAEVYAGMYMYLCCLSGRGEVVWKRRGPAATKRIATGDLGADGRREVAVGSTSWDVHVFGGSGFVFPTGSWVDALAFADVTGDGSDELLIGSQGKDCFAYAIDDTAQVLWRVPTGYTVHDLAAGDLDADGQIETLVAADDLYCLGSTGKLRWALGGGGATQVAAADLTGDGKPEVLAGAAAVEAFDGQGKRLWKQDTSYVWSLATADIDDDRRHEVLVTSYDNVVYLLDDGGTELWHAELGWIRANGAFADIDGQAGLEIVVADSQEVYAFDLSGRRLWTAPDRGGYCLQTGDTDANGAAEIAIGDGQGVRLLRGDGTEVWSYSVAENDAVNSVFLADLDGDGGCEVVAQLGNAVAVLSRDGKLLRRIADGVGAEYTSGKTRSVCATDLDGDGRPEIAAAGDGLVAVVAPTGREAWRASSWGHALAVGDVNGDDQAEVITAGERVRVRDARGHLLYQTERAIPGDSVVAADLDGDGAAEIIVGHRGVSVFSAVRRR